MRKFLTLVSLISLMVLALIYFILIQANGYSDPYYLRFTTPKQKSLIIGTSRAAQGIQPKYINQILSRTDIYNYSFALSISPYGATYLKSIKRKLGTNTKDGIFILAVDPWGISANKKNQNDSIMFEEANLTLGKTFFVNINPNPQYLFNNYDKPLYNLFLKQETNKLLHNDGWLEINVKMDSAAVNKRTQSKISDYKKEHLQKDALSEVRLQYLIKTIEFLKPHGKVFLVRLPVHPEIMNIENEFMPDFDEKIHSIMSKTNVPYLDLSYLNAQTKYVDGNHIYKESGAVISKKIGEWILNSKAQN